MKLITRMAAMAALAASARYGGAQSGYTNVTANLANVCYNNGSVQAAWQNGNPSSPTLPTLNGSPFNQYVPTGIDSNGNFYITIADTAIVQPNSPSLSSWNITACAKGGSQPACYTAKNVPVTGASMDVTSYFSAATSACTAAVVQVNGTALQKQNPQNFQDTSSVHFTNPSNGNIQATAVSGSAGINQLNGDVTAGPGVGNQTATLAASGVTAGTYTNPTTTVDAKGRVTNISSGSAGITQLTGDATAGPGGGSQPITLATVNTSLGPCGDATHIPQPTFNAKGLATGCAQISIGTDYYFTDPGCSVPAGGGAFCTDTITFTSGGTTTPTFPAMPDANYIPICTATVESPSTATVYDCQVTTLGTSSLTVKIGNTVSTTGGAVTVALALHLHHN